MSYNSFALLSEENNEVLKKKEPKKKQTTTQTTEKPVEKPQKKITQQPLVDKEGFVTQTKKPYERRGRGSSRGDKIGLSSTNSTRKPYNKTNSTDNTGHFDPGTFKEGNEKEKKFHTSNFSRSTRGRFKDHHLSGTGVGSKDMKKQGQGKANWGKEGEEYLIIFKNRLEVVNENKEEETEEKEEKVEEKIEENKEDKKEEKKEEEKKEEPLGLSLEEFQRQQREKELQASSLLKRSNNNQEKKKEEKKEEEKKEEEKKEKKDEKKSEKETKKVELDVSEFFVSKTKKEEQIEYQEKKERGELPPKRGTSKGGRGSRGKTGRGKSSRGRGQRGTSSKKVENSQSN
jgi:hypothetical protein